MCNFVSGLKLQSISFFYQKFIVVAFVSEQIQNVTDMLKKMTSMSSAILILWWTYSRNIINALHKVPMTYYNKNHQKAHDSSCESYNKW